MILIGASQVLDIMFCDNHLSFNQIAQLSFTVFRFREKCFYIFEREEDFFLSYTDLSVINSSSDVTEKLYLVF